jgi:LysR family glycine cleavage system transcriptional activator
LSRAIPPLNPLYVFEVASRVGSFTKAAELLSVSPSAVSRQITALEAYLDVRLFHRMRDGNILTEVGKEYCRNIAPAFATIMAATDQISRSKDTIPINVRVPSTFAVRFLIQRLSDFRTEYPNINVRIATGFGPVDFIREDVDISIQVGSGEWPGVGCKLLFPNWVEPMCSQKLLNGDPPITNIDDLRRVRLLVSKNRPDDWKDWMKAAGRPDFPLDQLEIIEFPNSMLAFQAAADALGVVIGQMPLLRPEFAAQPLLPLFNKPVRQGSYYAVWRAETGPSQKVRRFLDWLEKQLEPVLASLAHDAHSLAPTASPV